MNTEQLRKYSPLNVTAALKRTKSKGLTAGFVFPNFKDHPVYVDKYI